MYRIPAGPETGDDQARACVDPTVQVKERGELRVGYGVPSTVRIVPVVEEPRPDCENVTVEAGIVRVYVSDEDCPLAPNAVRVIVYVP